jgi:hypothetical protein
MAAVKNRDDDFTTIIKSNINRSLIQEHEFGRMSPSEIVSARMTKVSYINLKEGPLAALAFTNRHLKGWTLDTLLSDEHGAVFHRNGEVRVAYRGTQTWADWETNARLAAGVEGGVQLEAMENQLNSIVEKYGELPKILSGHSKGGGQALLLGERYGIDTHTQDPFVPTRLLVGGETSAVHKITRTTTDWVSSGANVSKFRDGFNTTELPPSAGTGILESHELGLMTGVKHNGTGSSIYDPVSKNKAFLAREIRLGTSVRDVAAAVGYERGSNEYQTLKSEYKAISRTNLQSHLDRAGYTPKSVSALGSAASKVVSTLTSAIGEGAVKVVNAQTGAAIAAGYGAAKALRAVGVDDEVVIATASGAMGNGAADLVGAGVRSFTNSGVESAAGVGLMGLGASMARGGIGGVLGFGVDRAVTAALPALGVDREITSITASALSGAASGAIFGPEGAMIGGLFGTVVAGVQNLIHANQQTQPTHDFMLQPFRNASHDNKIGRDPEIQSIIRTFNATADFSDAAVQQAEDQVTEKVLIMQGGTWGHRYDEYRAKLTATPRGTQERAHDNEGSTVMLPGNYDEIVRRETDELAGRIASAAWRGIERSIDNMKEYTYHRPTYNAITGDLESKTQQSPVSNLEREQPTHEEIHNVVSA